MAQTLTSGIKGSTKDIVIALFKSANKDIEEKGVNQKALEQKALEDMILARTGRSMIQFTGRLEAFQSNLNTTLGNATKIPAKLKTECEEVLKEIANYVKMRESLEKQFFEYANRAKRAPGDLTEKMSAVTKLATSLELKATDKLKELYQNIPGKSSEELRRILNPDDSERPHPE